MIIPSASVSDTRITAGSRTRTKEMLRRRFQAEEQQATQALAGDWVPAVLA